MNAPDDQEGILDLYKQGPDLLEQALHGLSDTELDAAPAQGGWSIREIVHHIVDGDDIWDIFIKMALGNQEGEFYLAWYWAKPQVEWAHSWAYADRAIDVSLALFKANRAHILQILGKIPTAWAMHAQFRKSDGTVEQVPVGAAVQIQANHVVHHIKRIQEIRTNLNEHKR